MKKRQKQTRVKTKTSRCRFNNRGILKVLQMEILEPRTVFDAGWFGGDVHAYPVNNQPIDSSSDTVVDQWDHKSTSYSSNRQAAFSPTKLRADAIRDEVGSRDSMSRSSRQSETSLTDFYNSSRILGEQKRSGSIFNPSVQSEPGRYESVRINLDQQDSMWKDSATEPYRTDSRRAHSSSFTANEAPKAHRDEYFQSVSRGVGGWQDSHSSWESISVGSQPIHGNTKRESIKLPMAPTVDADAFYLAVSQAVQIMSQSIVAQSISKEPSNVGLANRITIIQINTLPRISMLDNSESVRDARPSSINVTTDLMENVSARAITSNSDSSPNSNPSSLQSRSETTENRLTSQVFATVPRTFGIIPMGHGDYADLESHAKDMYWRQLLDLDLSNLLPAAGESLLSTDGSNCAWDHQIENRLSVTAPEGMVSIDFGFALGKPNHIQSWALRGLINNSTNRNQTAELADQRVDFRRLRNLNLPIPMEMELLEIGDAGLRDFETVQDSSQYRASLAGAFPLGVLQLFIGGAETQIDQTSNAEEAVVEVPNKASYGEMALAVVTGSVLFGLRWLRKKHAIPTSRDLFFSTKSRS